MAAQHTNNTTLLHTIDTQTYISHKMQTHTHTHTHPETDKPISAAPARIMPDA